MISTWRMSLNWWFFLNLMIHRFISSKNEDVSHWILHCLFESRSNDLSMLNLRYRWKNENQIGFHKQYSKQKSMYWMNQVILLILLVSLYVIIGIKSYSLGVQSHFNQNNGWIIVRISNIHSLSSNCCSSHLSFSSSLNDSSNMYYWRDGISMWRDEWNDE